MSKIYEVDETQFPVDHPQPQKTTHEIAERGHVATDQYGESLVSFDKDAEKRLRRKIDLYIVPTVAMLYLFCFIDRANIGNARLAGLEKDLGLKGYDYNIVLSVFYISYIIFEIPSTVMCKIVGPGWWLPGITLAFGLCSIFTAFCNNFSSICGVRFVLGLLEAGMLPGVAYYLSRWYRRSELTFRLSLYLVMAPLAGAFGGLLASAILTLPSFGSLRQWRMIFAIEGIITCGLALIGFMTLTDRPETARWLTQEEKDLAIARVKSERVATTEVLDRIDTRKFLCGFLNPVTQLTAVIFLLGNITVQGLAFFAPTIVRTIFPTATVVTQQLRTVPPYIVGAFFTVTTAYLSSKLNKRLVFFIFSGPVIAIGYVMFLSTTTADVRYGATFIIACGAFIMGPICNAHVSANVVSDTARSAAIGTVVLYGNIGGLISTWAFLPSDAPNYYIGNGLNLATAATTLVLSVVLYFWVIMDNRHRDRRSKEMEMRLSGLSQKQIQDLDWKHPAFRWHM